MILKLHREYNLTVTNDIDLWQQDQKPGRSYQPHTHIWRDSIYFRVHFYKEVVRYFTLCFVTCFFHLTIKLSPPCHYFTPNPPRPSMLSPFHVLQGQCESASVSSGLSSHIFLRCMICSGHTSLLGNRQACCHLRAFNFYIYTSLR